MDKTMIRNALAYHISRALGEYASRTRPCELVLNGEYRGVYVLTEKPKRDRNRLSLSKDEGYILKIDKFTGYKCADLLSTEAQGVDIQNDYPDCEVLSQEGRSYIDGYVTRFEKALFSEDFMSGETGYRQFLDTRSFVNHFICTELSKDVDGYRFSTFLHKEDTSKKYNSAPFGTRTSLLETPTFWRATSPPTSLRIDTNAMTVTIWCQTPGWLNC